MREDALLAREKFSYEAAIGVLTMAKAGATTGRFVGRQVGTVGINGYMYVHFNGKRHLAHRVIWLMVTGAWPAQQIDHIDGNPLNNAMANLRDVPPKVNANNKRKARKDSLTRVIGVQLQRGRYYAYIWRNGKKQSLGGFKTADLAANARIAAQTNFDKVASYAD